MTGVGFVGEMKATAKTKADPHSTSLRAGSSGMTSKKGDCKSKGKDNCKGRSNGKG
jgi:hypothetical protein